MSAAAPIRHAPLVLWQIARAFLATLDALFGAPERVAARGVLTYKPYAQLLSWLRCGEAMMRRLLLIEAQAYAKPNTRPLLRPARKRERKPMAFTAEHPEAWRVSFRVFMERRRPRRRISPLEQTAPAGTPALRKRISREDRWSSENWKPVKFRNAWPLAERYEALIRVFNDPTAYARRLSRRLHATPHRAGELLRAPPEAEHRIERFHEFADPPSVQNPQPADSS